MNNLLPYGSDLSMIAGLYSSLHGLTSKGARDLYAAGVYPVILFDDACTYSLSSSTIPRLPNELLEIVFDHADWGTRAACCMVSTRLQNVILRHHKNIKRNRSIELCGSLITSSLLTGFFTVLPVQQRVPDWVRASARSFNLLIMCLDDEPLCDVLSLREELIEAWGSKQLRQWGKALVSMKERELPEQAGKDRDRMFEEMTARGKGTMEVAR